MGLGWLDALHPDDRTSTEEALSDCLDGIEHLDLECRFRLPGGETSWVLMQLRPELDEYGILDGFFGSITDLVPSDPARDEAAELNRSESLGIFTGNLAHEFNNLLTPILLNLAIAKSAITENAGSADLLQRIEDAETATLRAHGLSRQLGDYGESAGSTDSREQMSPLANALAEAALYTTQSNQIEADLAIDDDLWPVKIEREQFSEAIRNLLHHAILSMNHGGAVRITAMNLEEGSYPGLGEIPGRHIAINIEELAGPALDEDYFPPLDLLDVSGDESAAPGLEAAGATIRGHGGHLIIESEIGAPSSFTVVLPATHYESVESSPPTPAETTALPQSESGLHLLVMDDEELVLNSMEALLTRLGHHVEIARDGSQALHIYQEAAAKGEPIDLALVDLTVPGGMGGKETVGELKSIDPEAVTIVCSGQAHNPVMSNFEAYGFSGAIQKPFRPGELQSLIGRLAHHGSKDC
jgi:CheY-like chemotaxis protein